MENIIFCGWYAKSNFNLSLTLLEELKKHYKIHYFGEESFRNKINELGIEFYSYIGVDEIEKNAEKAKYFYPDRQIITEEETINIEVQHNKHTLKFFSELTENMMGLARKIKPKYIFRDNSAIVGKFIAHKLGIKSIAFNSMLNILDEDMEKDPVTLYPFHKMAYVNRFKDMDKGFYKKIKDGCRENAKEFNLPYISPIAVIDSEDFINISFGGKPFQEEKKYDDKEYLIFKSELRQMEGYVENDLELERFLSMDKPLIYVGSGSFLAQPNEYYNNIIKAFANIECNVLISIPNIKTHNTNLPNNIMIRKFVPQKKILEVAKLFFSSGGYNSLSEAINYSVPIVVTPIDFDQEYNGYLVEKNNIGKKLRFDEINSKIINKLLQDNEIQRKNLLDIRESFFSGMEISKGIEYIMNKLKGCDVSEI